MKKHTPWGFSQTAEQIAPGIIRHDTASHGGYEITQERFEQMPADIRAVNPWAGPLWYEEDEDWALVCLAFPDVFPPDAYQFAVSTQQHSHPELITPERKKRADDWLAANQDKYAQGSAGTDSRNGRGWFVNAYRLANPEERISKVFAGIPLLPPVFTREQFENAKLYNGGF